MQRMHVSELPSSPKCRMCETRPKDGEGEGGEEDEGDEKDKEDENEGADDDESSSEEEGAAAGGLDKRLKDLPLQAILAENGACRTL